MNNFDGAMGFMFNGVAAASLGVYLEQTGQNQGGVHIPLLPPTKERLFKMPTRDGSWDYGAYFDDLKIELDCFAVQPDHGLLMANAAALAVLLDPRNGPRPLVLPDRTSYYMARYSGSLDFAPILEHVHFKLPFICTSPFPISLGSAQPARPGAPVGQRAPSAS